MPAAADVLRPAQGQRVGGQPALDELRRRDRLDHREVLDLPADLVGVEHRTATGTTVDPTRMGPVYVPSTRTRLVTEASPASSRVDARRSCCCRGSQADQPRRPAGRRRRVLVQGDARPILQGDRLARGHVAQHVAHAGVDPGGVARESMTGLHRGDPGRRCAADRRADPGAAGCRNRGEGGGSRVLGRDDLGVVHPAAVQELQRGRAGSRRPSPRWWGTPCCSRPRACRSWSGYARREAAPPRGWARTCGPRSR